jgi:hypothetical protein
MASCNHCSSGPDPIVLTQSNIDTANFTGRYAAHWSEDLSECPKKFFFNSLIEAKGMVRLLRKTDLSRQWEVVPIR